MTHVFVKKMQPMFHVCIDRKTGIETSEMVAFTDIRDQTICVECGAPVAPLNEVLAAIYKQLT